MKHILVGRYKNHDNWKAVEILLNSSSKTLEFTQHEIIDIRIDNVSKTVSIFFECNHSEDIISECKRVKELRKIFQKGISKL